MPVPKNKRQPKPKATTEPLFPKQRLLSLLPAAGMAYPYKDQVGRRTSADQRIVAMLDKYRIVDNLKRREVEPIMAQIFQLGNAFFALDDFQAQASRTPQDFPTKDLARLRNSAVNHIPMNAISFLYGTQKFICPQKETLAAKFVAILPFRVFTALFLILRSARLRWFDKPGAPYEVDQHTVLPTEIDKFLERSKSVEWGGLERILWLRDGGMWLDPFEGKKEYVDEAMQDDGDDVSAAGASFQDENDGDVEMEDAEWPEDETDRMEAVIELIKRLKLGIDEDALAKVFQRLSLQ